MNLGVCTATDCAKCAEEIAMRDRTQGPNPLCEACRQPILDSAEMVDGYISHPRCVPPPDPAVEAAKTAAIRAALAECHNTAAQDTDRLDAARFKKFLELMVRLEHDPACVMTYIASGKVKEFVVAIDAELRKGSGNG